MIRSGAASGVPATELARSLGVSRGAVIRTLGKRQPAKVRTAAEFQGSSFVAPRREQPVDSWSLEQIRKGRDAQMRGDFKQAVRLAEMMRTDDALFVARRNRIAPMLSVGVSMIPVGNARGEATAARAERSIFTPRSVLAGICGSLADHGIAIGYNVQVPSDDGSRVDFYHTHWPLEHVKWNASLERLETAVRGGARVPIEHGNGFWVVYRKFHDLPWTQDACLLAAAMIWAAHAGGLKAWLASADAHGLAKVMGELPEGVALIDDASGTITPEARAYLNMLQDLVSGAIGAGLAPAGSKTDFVSNASTAWQVFTEIVENREKAAARVYLGTDAILGANGGAPGVDISALFAVATTVIQSDFEALEQGLATGVYQPWTAINDGDSRYAPSAKFQLPDPDEKAKSEENAAKRSRLNQTLKEMKEQGFVIDQGVVNTLAKEYGVSPPPILGNGGSQDGPAHAGADGRGEGGARA